MLLRRYLFTQLFGATLWAFVVISAIMFAGIAIQFTHRYADLGVAFLIGKLPGLMAMSLPYSIAFAVLSGVTLTVARITSDRELTLMAINGISPAMLAWPALVLGAMVCSVAFFANFYWQPRGFLLEDRLKYHALQAQLEHLPSGANSIDLPGFSLAYKDHRDGRFAGVTLIAIRDEPAVTARAPTADDQSANATPADTPPPPPGPGGVGYPARLIVARFASIQFFPEDRQIVFLFEDCFVTEYPDPWPPASQQGQLYYRQFTAVLSPFADADEASLRAKSMDLAQLRASFGHVQTRIEHWREQLSSATQALEQAEASGEADPNVLAALEVRVKGCRDNVVWEHLLERIAHTEWYRRVALTIAPMLFILLGIPVGMLVRHGNRLVAFCASTFVVAIVYYPLLMLGRDLGETGTSIFPAAIGISTETAVAWLPSSSILLLAFIAYKVAQRRE